MSALVQRIEEDLQSRAANDDDINGGLWTRTKFAYVNNNPLTFTDPTGFLSRCYGNCTGSKADVINGQMNNGGGTVNYGGGGETHTYDDESSYDENGVLTFSEYAITSDTSVGLVSIVMEVVLTLDFDFSVLQDWNGNLLEGYDSQDYVCSSIGAPLNGTAAEDICVTHDSDYAENGCNASSWVTAPFAPGTPCGQANWNAATSVFLTVAEYPTLPVVAAANLAHIVVDWVSDW